MQGLKQTDRKAVEHQNMQFHGITLSIILAYFILLMHNTGNEMDSLICKSK